jgi:hypothetical protein
MLDSILPPSNRLNYKALYPRLQKIEPTLPENPVWNNEVKVYFDAFFTTEKHQIEEMEYFKKCGIATDDTFKQFGKKSRLEMLEQRSLLLDAINMAIFKTVMDDDELELDLHGKNLTRFPSQLLIDPEYRSYWQGLMKLNLKGNNLRTLPKEIDMCQALEILDCRQNKLTTLPDRLANCKNIKKLHFENNKIKTMPLAMIIQFGWMWAKDNYLRQGGQRLSKKPMAVSLTPAFKRASLSRTKLISRSEYFQLLAEAEAKTKGLTP